MRTLQEQNCKFGFFRTAGASARTGMPVPEIAESGMNHRGFYRDEHGGNLLCDALELCTC
jgi:hypothetical protein